MSLRNTSFESDFDDSTAGMSPSSPHSALSPDDGALLTQLDSTYIKFINATLCDAGKLHRNGFLVVNTRSGVIVSSSMSNADARIASDDITIIDLDGLVLAPGFIDAQLNGAFGLDFSDITYGDGSTEAFEKGFEYVCKQLLRTGVTSFCPTLPSTYQHVYKKVLPSLRSRRTATSAESLGYHLEGPFLSPKKPGCHPRDAIMTAPKRIDSFREVYGGDENLNGAAIITVAAEQEGVMESIKDLSNRGIAISLGHSVLDYDGGVKAVNLGASMVTHVYNAMTQPHHREPGLFGLLGATKEDLSNGQRVKPFYGIIADGIHVHRSGVSVAYHAHTKGCCLVTDAMFPMGLPSGTYGWGEQSIVKDDLRLFLNGTNTIAGSAVELDTSLRNLMQWAQIPIEKAIETVTSHPAQVIGVQERKGTLRSSADADLTILDHEGHVKQVYKLGVCVYRANASKN